MSTRQKKFLVALVLLAIFCSTEVTMALDRPFIGVTFFYWYTWDYKKEWGGWIDGGVDNTPLMGYYDSPSYADNYRSLWTASEWGVTHHYMDYWGPGWKAKDNKTPRETVIIQAAEALQKEGYDINMSFLQDGYKFNMDDFSKNISDPKNPDVRFWLDNYAKSPTWIKHNGKPFWLIYANSGAPKITAENLGFRKYLENKYGSIDRLNKQWDATYSSFKGVVLDFSKGWNRAESINYQFIVWQNQMDEMNRLVKEKYGWDGITPAFDVWCEPYKGFGYSNYHKVLGGPHSYGGVFNRPEFQDPQRFIQSAVAKQYNTVFHDHYKNFYCDWNTESRIPGFRYAPEPFHFDRFWVGDLMRYAEAIYHLSWNEWWEGSNLEPDFEHGKKYCEKNLFYSTIMKECFESIHNYAKGAKVALLLNDWSWLWGGNSPTDVYGIIQSLRLFGISFELIPDDFVDAKKFENFNLVIAPSNGTGFGYNKDGKSIAKIMQEWVEQKSGRRLIVSSSPEFIKYLGLSEGKDKVKGAEKKSVDFLKGDKEKNIAWAILGEQDQNNNLSVSPSGEGEVKVAKKGGRSAKTVGENPNSPTTRYMYFNVDDNFIFNGSWPEVKLTVEYLDEGEGEVGLEYDSLDMSVMRCPVPGAFKSANEKITLENSGKWKSITFTIDDARFNNSSNGQDFRFYMGGEFVVGKVTIEKIGEQDAIVLFDKAIFVEEQDKVLPAPVPKHISRTIGRGKPLSYYNSDLTPRDIVFLKGKGEILYVNDIAGAVEYKPYWEKIFSNWAKIDVPKTVYGDNIRGARLYSGNTNILLAYNYDSTKKSSCVMQLDCRGLIYQTRSLGSDIMPEADPPWRESDPYIAEVVALCSDGNEYKVLPYEIKDGKVQFQDEIQYFGVYEVVFSPLAISHTPLLLHPGEKTSVELTLKNLSDSPISGTLKLKSIIPTLGSDILNYSLASKEEKKVNISIWAKSTVDWGNKTIMWATELFAGAQVQGKSAEPFRTVYWRPLLVERNPDLVITTKVLDWKNPVLGIKNQEYGVSIPGRSAEVYPRQVPAGDKPPRYEEKGFIANATANDVVVTIDGKATLFSDIASNQEVSKPLTLEPLNSSSASIEHKTIKISYLQNGVQTSIEDTIALMVYPEKNVGATSATKDLADKSMAPASGRINPTPILQFYLCNSGENDVTDRLFKVNLPQEWSLPFKLTNDLGESIPVQIDGKNLLFVSTLLSPDSCVLYTLTKGEKGNEITDLALTSQDLGTGKGTLTVSNKHYALTLSEEAGGTAINFTSAKTSFNYANKSFGINYGQFSQYDPLKPAQSATEFINEKKTRQSDKPGKIKVLLDGPIYKKVEVSWNDENFSAKQIYEFYAFQKQFRVTVDIQPKQTLTFEELVAFDACFFRNKIRKIFPGGSGMSQTTQDFKKEVPHAGFRYGDFVHPYSTFISAGENISLIIEEKSGLNKYRQGFWPKERPKSGKIKYAGVEYITFSPKEPVHLIIWVMIHAGANKTARKFQEELFSPFCIVSKM